MTTALETPRKFAYVGVEFRWGSCFAHALRITDFTRPVTINGHGYDCMPNLEVKIPVNSGTLEDKVASVGVPLSEDDTHLSVRASNGEPHSPIYCIVWEVVERVDLGSGIDANLLKLFSGKVETVLRNFQGNERTVVFNVKSLKARLNVPLGLVATNQCAWTFGDRGCAVDAVALRETGTLVSISGKDVVISGLSAQVDKYWHRGFVEIDGLRITIRDWDEAAGTTFKLVRQPPTHWVGQPVVVTPGCDKTIETCRDRWDNEERFGGFGYGIPAYMPIYEDPP
jgi:hypothetical protein